jgi:HlyD family secretion protein
MSGLRTRMPRALRAMLALGMALAIAGCARDAPQALGTLEYDRIALPSPAAERIVAIDVREGQSVAAGDPLLRLDDTRTRAQLTALQAQSLQAREALSELQAGPREEAIAQARAGLLAAEAQARDARGYFARLQPLGEQRLVAAADVDRARAAAGSANAQVSASRQALLELERGTRGERLAQGQAAAQAAEAQVAAQQATLAKLAITAPRAGRVDSLPFRLGDEAPVGAPLAVLLVGDAPYARVYVPEPIRVGVDVGGRARVYVDGREGAIAGTVRMIRSEPTFTPYYALAGDDAARLSWLAEVQLDGDGQGLPAGMPVRVEFESE